MSDESNKVSRRAALKSIAVGVGAAGSLPILGDGALGQHNHNHPAMNAPQARPATKSPAPSKFFTAPEMVMVTILADQIIPTDERSPGAKAADVPAFLDLMVSKSPKEIQDLWRDGLAAVERMSRSKYVKSYNAITAEQQTALLTEISKNELNPRTLEERFFRALKNLTIDGYYTSEIGIQQDLQYKGNAYLKEFKGCTHPEHQA